MDAATEIKQISGEIRTIYLNFEHTAFWTSLFSFFVCVCSVWGRTRWRSEGEGSEMGAQFYLCVYTHIFSSFIYIYTYKFRMRGKKNTYEIKLKNAFGFPF